MKYNKYSALLKIASMTKNSQSIAFGGGPVPMISPTPKPTQGKKLIGDVKGLDPNGLLNKYLSKLPYTDAPHTDNQFWTAVDLYKSKVPEKHNRTQDLLGDAYALSFQGVPFTDEARHQQNQAGINALFDLYNPDQSADPDVKRLAEPGPYSLEKDHALRDRLLELAYTQGNEPLRNALYSSMTNKIYQTCPPKAPMFDNPDMSNVRDARPL